MQGGDPALVGVPSGSYSKVIQLPLRSSIWASSASSRRVVKCQTRPVSGLVTV
jgi:hypothetical protein